MRSGSRAGGGGRGGAGGSGTVLNVRTKNTIRSIKEIVGNHSEAEIYAALKETGMDPNEAAAKLLNQDPFHEVRRKRDKKEIANFKASVDPDYCLENSMPMPKSQEKRFQNSRRGNFAQNTQTDAGINRQFRVVRDNRVNQQTNYTAGHESIQQITSRSEQASSYATEKRNSKLQAIGSIGPPGYGQYPNSTGTYLQVRGSPQTVSNSGSTKKIASQKSEMQFATPRPTSAIGVYSSSSDPVHIPSPDSRAAGTVGVVGVRHPPSDHSISQSNVPNSSSVSPRAKDIAVHSESIGEAPPLSKNTQVIQNPGPEPLVTSVSTNRSFSPTKYSNKQYQQPVGHPKATQSNMEWKPKLSKKTNTISSQVINSITPPALTLDKISSGFKVQVTSLSDELSQVSINANEHVVIPQHLRVPEEEKFNLTFGSFEAGINSPKDFMSAIQEFGLKVPANEALMSISASMPVLSAKDVPAGDKVDFTDCHSRTSQSDAPASEETSSETAKNLRILNSENYTEVGLLDRASLSHSHSPQNKHQSQTHPNLPGFSEEYDTKNSFDLSFFKASVADDVRGQPLTSPPETLNLHEANNNPSSTVAMVQQQQLPQHQQVAQLYPQMQFANYLPYRQFIPPMYVPQMAVPNYSNNPAYPHPSNGSSYVLMPGGASQLNAAGMKYKPVPTSSTIGYGNYTNPAAYSINGPGAVGAASNLDDANMIKYKDSNFFVPNAQTETPEIWVQSPRDLPGMQSAPYFNMPGQLPHASFMPSHGNHAPFNAQQTSHIFHQGLYQAAQQQPNIANTHHLVHQQLPSGIGGNVGIGVATPSTQIGSYQQPQLGQPSWNAYF